MTNNGVEELLKRSQKPMSRQMQVDFTGMHKNDVGSEVFDLRQIIVKTVSISTENN